MEEGALVPKANSVMLNRDYVFSSVSMAAIAVPGRSANGWIEWKTE